MLRWQARSNPLAWWWGSLTLVSAANILVWFMLYREFYPSAAGSISGGSDIGLMFLLCAGYVFGCAFRSILPRADVQGICLFDTWLSSVFVGRIPRPRSLQNHSAVNHQDLASHVIGRRRSQEPDRANDVTGLGGTAEQDRSGKILHGLAGR